MKEIIEQIMERKQLHEKCINDAMNRFAKYKRDEDKNLISKLQSSKNELIWVLNMMHVNQI